MDNNVTLIGTIGSEPDLRYTQSGTAMLGFSLAIGDRRKNKETGQYEDGETSWYRVIAFKELAENAASSLGKGDRVMVNGRLAIRKWEDKEGKPGVSVEVTADEIGPSLRWATASVEKTHRRSGEAAPRRSEPEDPFGDEEPF